MGHAGTLDPMATGVLVVAIGEATKLVPYLTADDKAYETTLVLGRETDTLDADGKETARRDVAGDVREALAAAPDTVLPRLQAAIDIERGRRAQMPPAYSAIRKGGERAYEKARRGEDPELTERPVAVRALDVLAGGTDPEPWITLRVEVQKGYFVRALARDLAASLGTVGHLTSLRRTRSGSFTLEDALPMDTPGDEIAARVILLEHAAARALPVAVLSEIGARDARFGRAVAKEHLDVSDAGPHAWLDAAGQLVAVGEVVEGESVGRVLRGFGGLPSVSS